MSKRFKRRKQGAPGKQPKTSQGSADQNAATSQPPPASPPPATLTKKITASLMWVLAIFGALSIPVFLLSIFQHRPRLAFNVAGEQFSDKIPLPAGNQLLLFSIGSESGKSIALSDITVNYDPQTIRLVPNAEHETALDLGGDQDLSMLLRYKHAITIPPKNKIALAVRYEIAPSTRPFRLRFEAIAKVADWEASGLTRMYPPQATRFSKEYFFVPTGYPKTEDPLLKKVGLKVGPKEGMRFIGEAAQQGLSCIADKATVPVKVIELFDPALSKPRRAP